MRHRLIGACALGFMSIWSATSWAADAADQLAGEYVRGLKGIEAHFMKLDGDDPQIVVEKVRLLMLQRGEAVPAAIESRVAARERPAYQYSINTLDRRNGYLRLDCRWCETAVMMTYWKLPGGGELIGLVERGCGPVCSDELKFFRPQERGLARVPDDQIVAPLRPADFLRNPADTAVLKRDNVTPFLLYHLPQRGTDILVEMETATDRQAFKGSCLPLRWDKGRFRPGEFTFCSPRSAQ